MTEKPETPQILDEIAKGTRTKAVGSRSQQTARRRFLIVLLLLLPLIAGLGYLGYLQIKLQAELTALQQQHQSTATVVARQQSRLDELDAGLASLPRQTAPDDSATRQLSARLDAELARLEQQLARLTAERVTGATPQTPEWKILEAGYLVQLANRKLQLEADPPTAMLLLQQADAALVASGSSAVLRARQALAEDLVLLRELEMLDREGLYLRVASLQEQISGIDLLTSMRENFQNRRSDLSTPAAADNPPRGLLEDSLDLLRRVFIWRRWEDSPQAVLVPGQEVLILQRMQLILERIQLALLTADTALYQHNLTAGLAWLRQYAVDDSSAGQAVRQELIALQQIDIAARLPELGRSVNALQQLADGLRATR